MTYAQKLRSPLWQKKRLQILERDKWSCQCCESTTKNLQVHHLYYMKVEPWEYPDEAYQTLCEDCHKERQKIVDEAINNIREMLGKIPTSRLEETLDVMALNVDYSIAHLPPRRKRTPPPPEIRPEPTMSGKELFAAMRAAAAAELEGGKNGKP